MDEIIVNGKKLEVDFLDADFLEKYEELTHAIVEAIQDKTAYAGKTNAESLRYQCECVNEYFDELFGEGTAEKMFGINGKLSIRLDAFAQLGAIAEHPSKFLDETKEKYGFVKKEGNREQRRAAQKQKQKNAKKKILSAGSDRKILSVGNNAAQNSNV